MRSAFLTFHGLALGLAVLCLGFASVARSEITDPQKALMAAVETLQEEVKDNLNKAALSLDALRKKVDEAAKADAQLAQLKLKADLINQDILQAMANLQSRYNIVSKRLEELGAAPADGATPEDEKVAADRKRLQSEKAVMNTILSDADALKTEASRIATDITDKRRELFAEMLFRQTPITPAVISAAMAAANDETSELASKSGSSLEFMWNFKRGNLAFVLFLSVIAAVVIIVPVKWMFSPYLRRDVNEAKPSYIHRLSLAFWSALIPAVGVAVFVLTNLILLLYFSILREDIFEIYKAILWMLAGVYFVWKLARAIVAPTKPQWRLVPVSDRGARMLVLFAVALGGINGLNYVFGATNEALDSPVVLTVAKGFVSSILIGIVLLLMSFIRPMQVRPGTADTGAWPGPVRVLQIAMGLGLIVTALFGYIGLAQFVATQIIVTGAIAVTMYLGFLGGHAISRQQAFGGTAGGRYLGQKFGLSTIKLDQIGLLAGLSVYAVVVAIGLPAIMIEWGFRGVDIWGLFIRLFTEIQVGNITISLLGIIVGIVMFVGGLYATRWFQRWLDRNVLARSEVDVGVRNSINTALGYLGVGLAALIGVSAAGIDLSSLALVAGALSLGIGFGLQTIVSNFVSGLILLAERPFKVGDWIVAGTVEGFVRRISVRATEIETFQNQSIIVPNAQLINASVGNWTLRNKLGRSEIPVSVSYDSDPRQVMDILLEIANAHPLVMTVPEPNVAFLRFGDSSLDFELRIYLADLLTGLGVRNDLRLSIFERFREERIEIPFPQRNLNIRFTDDTEALETALAREGLSPEATRRIREQAEIRRKSMEANVRDIDGMDNDSHAPLVEPDEGDDDAGQR